MNIFYAVRRLYYMHRINSWRLYRSRKLVIKTTIEMETNSNCCNITSLHSLSAIEILRGSRGEISDKGLAFSNTKFSQKIKTKRIMKNYDQTFFLRASKISKKLTLLLSPNSLSGDDFVLDLLN